MSVLSRVMEESESVGSDRTVLFVLAYRADLAGLCWPSNRWVSKRAKLKPATVATSIRQLEADGELVRFAREREDGGRTSNLIFLARYADPAAVLDHIAQSGQCAELIRAYLSEVQQLPPPFQPEGGPLPVASTPPFQPEGGPPSSQKGRDSILYSVGDCLKTDANASGAGTNGVPVAAPLAAHTNGSTQPEPLASPGLPSVAVNGASPGAYAGEPPVLPAPPKRSARNGKASGADAAEPDPERAAESKLVFGELCTWLGLDWQRLPANTRGKLNKTTAALLDAGLGADAVEAARDAWRDDWRAKGGRAPEIGMVEDLVARAAANGTRPKIDMSEVF